MPRDSAAHAKLVRLVAHGLRHRCQLPEGSRLIVAVSGGADSVALLRSLSILAPRRNWNLHLAVAHVQHHLREQAEADARMVESLADQLDLPFLRADLNLTACSCNLEAAARHARYAALTGMAQSFDTRYVVTAHHAQDQFETVLMRLIRGSSVRGLSGMAWKRSLSDSPDAPLLLRPMLNATRDDVTAFLQSIGQSWCEDHTNADLSRLRARLRHQVVPTLLALAPDAAQRSVALGDHLRQMSQLLDEAISRAADHVIVEQNRIIIDRVAARLLCPDVLTGLLRRLLLDAGVPADQLGRPQLSPFVTAIRDRRGQRREFTFANGIRATVLRSTIELESLPHSRQVKRR